MKNDNNYVFIEEEIRIGDIFFIIILSPIY